MNLGIFSGLFAGAFWGFAFLVPRVLNDVSPSQIALHRFLWFGALSLFGLIFQKGFRKGAPFFRHAKTAIVLSISGYSLYYFLLVAGIQLTGIPVSSLLIGLLPVTIALFSQDHLHRPKLFVTAVSLIVIGMIVLNLPVFDGSFLTEFPHAVLGIVLSILCLILWTVFGVGNARFLKKHVEVNSTEWANILGVYTALTMISFHFLFHILPIASLEGTERDPLDFKFVAFTAFLGLFPTFIASRLWNYASRILPTGLVAQLIVSETVFALVYSFLYERRIPVASETVAMVLMLLGVWLAVKSYAKPASPSKI